MRGWLATVLVLVSGCLLLDPLDDVRLDAGGGGTGGIVSTGGSGGSGGDSCSDVVPSSCVAVSPVPFSGPGSITVTDMLDDETGGVVTAGVYTGNVSFGGPQLSAGSQTRGFVVAHDQAGGFVRQADLGEAFGDGARVVVALTSNSDVAVGGSYRAAGGTCTGDQGVFIKRLTPDATQGFVEVYSTCVQASSPDAAQPTDLAVSTQDYVSLVGSLQGTLDGMASNGIDGFMFEVEPDGTDPDVLLFTGNGDAVIRGVTQHEIDANQWLVVGDFTGELRVDIPLDGGGTLTRSTTATGSRDLFVVAIDRFDMMPNLSIAALGGRDASHRAVALSSIPEGAPGSFLLLAEVQGPLTAGTETIAPPSEPSAMVLAFTPPNDEPETALGYVDHQIVSAPFLDAVDLAATPAGYHLAGTAAQTITVAAGDDSWAESVESDGCQRDAFVLSVIPGEQSVENQRCGDGEQQLHALARRGTAGFAATITVPPGAQIDFSGSEPAEAGLYLLLSE